MMPLLHELCNGDATALAVLFASDLHRDVSLTYAELRQAAALISAALRESLAQPGECVAVCVHLSVHLPAILLGVLESDCYFLALDPEESASFLEASLRRARVRFVIASANDHAVLTKFSNVTTPAASANISGAERFCCLTVGENVPASGDEHPQLAYAMQTSGTTGEAKLVRVPHLCIVSNIIDLRRRFTMHPYDRVLLASPLTFDPSIVDLFLALSSGAALLIVPADVKAGPADLLAAVLFEHRVSVLQVTPTLFARFSPSIVRRFLDATSPLRVLAFGGERMPAFNRLRDLRHPQNTTRLFNLYGITECSCWATVFEVDWLAWQSDDVPIGEVLLDTELRFVDVSANGSDNSVDDVAAGDKEVLIGGNMRRCIVGDESWTHTPIFRHTGDVCRRIGPHLFIVGRRDFQLKRFGKRLSLDDVERAALKVPHIHSCCVLLSSTSQLIAFVVAEVEEAFDETEFRDSLESGLPAYSIPERVYRLDALPLTKHGKVDRLALLALANAYEELPSFDIDDVLSGVLTLVRTVLSLDRSTAINDSTLSSLGCNSLKMITLLHLLERWCGRQLPPDAFDVLQQSTLSAIAAYVQQRRESAVVSAVPLRRRLSDEQQESKRRRHSAEVTDDGAGVWSVQRANRVEHWLRRADSVVGRSFFELELVWSWDSGKCIDASPLVVVDEDGGDRVATIFIGSHSHTFAALDLRTGEARWVAKLGDRIEASAVLTPCANFVVVGCYDGGVYFFDRKTGVCMWRFATSDCVKSSALPLRLSAQASNSVVCVGSYDRCFYCLDYNAKSVRWKSALGGAILSTPVASDDGDRVFVATLSSRVFCLEASTGAIIWQLDLTMPVFSSLVYIGYGPAHSSTDEVAVGCVDNAVHFVRAHDGSLSFSFRTDGPIFATPAIYRTTADVLIAVASNDKHVYVLDCRSKALLYKLDIGGEMTASPFFSLPAEGGRMLIAVTSTDGRLKLLSLPPQDEQVASFMFAGETFGSPVLLGDRIVQGCRDNRLYVLAVKPK